MWSFGDQRRSVASTLYTHSICLRGQNLTEGQYSLFTYASHMTVALFIFQGL